MVLMVFANLVLAADWHPRVGDGGVDPMFEAHQPHEHSELSVEHATGDHTKTEPGCCVQHACHAHSHLFSIDTLGYQRLALGGGEWLTQPLPLPPTRFLTPDVPPPIA